jgi:uncharacterized coiled-coil protein SlyX
MIIDIAIVYKILAGVIGLVGILCVGHIKWMTELKKRIESRLLKLEERVEELRITQVTQGSTFIHETRAREVIKEEVAPIKESIHELKEVVDETGEVIVTVREKVSALVTEVRIINSSRGAKD